MKKLRVQIILCAILLLNSLQIHAMMAQFKNYFKRPQGMVRQQKRLYRPQEKKELADLSKEKILLQKKMDDLHLRVAYVNQSPGPFLSNTFEKLGKEIELTEQKLKLVNDEINQFGVFSRAWNWLTGSSQSAVEVQPKYAIVKPAAKTQEMEPGGIVFASESSYFPTPEIDKKSKEFFGKFAMEVPKNNAQVEEADNKIISNFRKSSFPKLDESIKQIKDYINYMEKKDSEDRTSQIYSYGFRISKFEAPISAAKKILGKLYEFKKQPAKTVIFNTPFIKNMDQKDVSMEPFIGLNTTPFLLKFVSGNYLSDVEAWFDAQQEFDLLAALSKKVIPVFNEINNQCEEYEKQYAVLSDNEEISFQIRKQISKAIEWLKNTDQEIEQKYIIPLNWYANSLWSASAKVSDDIKLQLNSEISKTIGMANKARRRVLQLLKQYQDLSSKKGFSISVGMEEDDEESSEWRRGESYQQAVGRKYGKWAQDILEQEHVERMRNESGKE